MSCLYDLARILIYRRCDGYYLRWYYNGWHYWYFYQGKIGYNTEGEKYRTLGTQTLTIGTGQITEAQANAIRTIMNTREIYIYTDAGWGAVRAIHSPLVVYDHVTHGYEMEFTIVIGSRAISITGFSPAIILPPREPDPQCELDIAVAGQIWMCKNWDAAYPGSRVYDNDEDNRAALGGLYTYEQVMTPGFVPDGWHVPTVDEWNTLITACGGAAAAGGVLKEIGFTRWNAPNTGAVDTHNFTAVGGGYSSPSAYGGVYDSGMFWTADPYDVAPVPPNTFASYVRMSHDSAAALVEYLPRNYYMCLRLIKNYYCPACVALAATNIGNSNFTANWTAVTGATGYYLDVSTDPAFGSFVPSYHNLYVGNVLTYDVTGLTPGVTYYYRMRSQTATCISVYSNAVEQATPGALLMTSRGDGLGVGYLNITTTGGVTLSLDGTARFYSDAAGTLDESTTWTPAAGTFPRYIRVPSGTANLMFSDITKLTQLGTVTSPNSGGSGWSYNTGLTSVNVPRLTCDNWDFPNCVQIALNQSTIATFNFAITDLSANLTRTYLYASGTATGDLTDVPASCTILGLNNTSNLITGDLADLPAGLLMMSVGTGNTISGDIADLPAGLTTITLAGSNTITGDIADLPAGLLWIQVAGYNTISGDVADLPATVTLISVQGSNTITGDLNDILNTVTYISLDGANTLYGDMANMPTGMTQFDVQGDNTLSGGFTGLPAVLIRLVVVGSNTINGDLADLPTNLQSLFIQGSNTVSGSLADLTAFASLYGISITGSNVISGAIADIPAVCTTFDIRGANTIAGDLGDLPVSVRIFVLQGSNTVTDYSGKGWLAATYDITLTPTGVGGLSAAEVDQFFIDIDTDCPFASGSHVLIMTGTNAAPTATSAAARASLAAKGVNITTN